MAEMAGHPACAVEALLCTGPWFLALGGVVAKLASAGAPLSFSCFSVAAVVVDGLVEAP